MPSRRPVRARVVESWFRSAAAGVWAETVDAPITLPGDALRDHREAHPLARVFPLLDDVLGQAARDCDAVMAVSDAVGQLLWVCGSPSVLRRAEAIGFVEGSNWDERLAGTNAPGMALTVDDTVEVGRAEHDGFFFEPTVLKGDNKMREGFSLAAGEKLHFVTNSDACPTPGP